MTSRGVGRATIGRAQGGAAPPGALAIGLVIRYAWACHATCHMPSQGFVATLWRLLLLLAPAPHEGGVFSLSFFLSMKLRSFEGAIRSSATTIAVDILRMRFIRNHGVLLV